MAEGPALMVVAGEHSGDRHAAALVRAFAARGTGARWFGAGGPELASAGVEVLVPLERLAVVGIGEVVGRLPDLLREFRRLKEALRERRPRALVLVDFPDFNFRLARFARTLGVPVVYYITPQVWAWRRGRTRFLRDFTDLCLVIFPFEEAFLRDRGVRARFVGHPLAGQTAPPSRREDFLTRHGFPPGVPRLALLPGSRSSEVERTLPVLRDAARLLKARRPGSLFLVPWAPGLPEALWERCGGAPLQRIQGEYLDVLGHADAAAVASGTATLEAALLGVPQVIVYRVSALTYLLGKTLVRLPRVGLPNVVLGRDAVPELLQGECTAPRVAEALEGILVRGEGARKEAERLAGEVQKKLGEGLASARAAEVLEAFLGEVRRPSGPCRP
ncbi:MAG: lipid-A-disaccharide synthase [Acidobacteriota bacterium]